MLTQNNAILREQLRSQLMEILQEMDHTVIIDGEKDLSPAEKSKQNLLAFLAFQKFFSQELEKKLIIQGLTSGHQIHPHVLFSLIRMIDNISHEKNNAPSSINILEPSEATRIKERRICSLLGTNIDSGANAIMVTLDRRMLHNPNIFAELLRAGMTIARINCAHGSPDTWRQLVRKLREIEEKDREFPRCKIYMDLPGPKLRITELQKGHSPHITDGAEATGKTMKLKLQQHSIIRIYRSASIPDSHHVELPSLAVNLPKALANVKCGDRVFVDDGKVMAKVVTAQMDYIEAKFIRSHKDLVTLETEKGLNLPDSLTYLNIPAFTQQDLECLPIICELADMIGLSYVHQPHDIQKLRDQIEHLTSKKIGIVAKIETKASFHHLAKILLEGLDLDSFGIMIARGDLAVEMGFEQLAVLQDLIRILCDAAHIPVIWATGVLEKMSKKGIPARTEITDLFIGLKADCIMLNKGRYIVDAVQLIKQVNNANPKSHLEVRNFLFPYVQYGF